jgi:hypothetical protein
VTTSGVPQCLPRLALRALVGMLAATCITLPPAPLAAQTSRGWAFEDDAFADLWFHGLAVTGFYGFGPFPLYDPDYTSTLRRELRAAGAARTSLEEDRADLLAHFRSDDAFEVLHFLPLYFHGAGRQEALTALTEVSATPRGPPQTSGATRFGVSVVAGLLTRPGERKVLGDFVHDLSQEWQGVVAPRRTRDQDTRDRRMSEIRHAWETEWSPALSAFLQREGMTSGTAIVVPALGAEGRFLERDPAGAPGPLVALGSPEGPAGAAATLSSLVRELCYPVVRRVFASFEARFEDRIEASRASDLTATRCGELLLERRLPAQVPAYRARFGLPPQGSGRAFLSASGQVPGAAAWEGDLEGALLRELNLEPNAARHPAPPVRRQQ